MPPPWGKPTLYSSLSMRNVSEVHYSADTWCDSAHRNENNMDNARRPGDNKPPTSSSFHRMKEMGRFFFFPLGLHVSFCLARGI